MDLKGLEGQVEKILGDVGFRLMSLRFVTEDNEKYLRVVIDKYHHNVSLDEIVTISDKINTLLDELDINESYILDVTTTGAEKAVPLNEIQDYVNTYVHVTKEDGIKGPPTVEGTLLSVDDETLTIEVNNKGRKQKTTVGFAEIKKVRRAVKM